MQLFFLLITILIIWLVVRNRKAKKTKKAEYQARKQIESDPTLGPVLPPSRPHMRGKPVTESNFPKKMKDVYEAADNFGKIKMEDPENPDMAFACTKRAFEANSKDVANLSLELNEDSRCCRCLRWGLQLAIFYRDGYGCEPNPKAAIEVLKKIDPIWVRMFNYISQMANANRLSQDQAAYANQIVANKIEAWQTLGDCCAILGKGGVADEFYKRSYEQAKVCANPDYMREQIILHAMGDYPAMYGNFSVTIPHPMRFGAATELAMSMAGQKKPLGGQFLMALLGVRNLDVNALGRSWEEDFRIYSNADGAFPMYRTGLALVYGLGTAQDVKTGLSLMAQAYEQGCIMAAYQLYKYYNSIKDSSRLNTSQQKIANKLASDWSRKYERMKADPSALEKIRGTGAVNDEMAEYGGRYSKASAAGSAQAATYEDYDEPEESWDSDDEALEDEFDIMSMPFIIFDDSENEWRRRGKYGDHAVYYNRNGDEVTIYNAQISGTTASTSAGTMHWY